MLVMQAIIFSDCSARIANYAKIFSSIIYQSLSLALKILRAAENVWAGKCAIIYWMVMITIFNEETSSLRLFSLRSYK